LKGKKIKADLECYLHGYWGDNMMTTMMHQSVLLGIPSLQLEIPSSVRKLLNDNDEFRDKFLNALINVYNQVIVPYFIDCNMSKGIKINHNCLQNVKQTLLDDKKFID